MRSKGSKNMWKKLLSELFTKGIILVLKKGRTRVTRLGDFIAYWANSTSDIFFIFCIYHFPCMWQNKTAGTERKKA
jgi:hypothetical protein